MPYDEQLPKWEATGTEPPDSKKTSGWQAEDKPPAAWWNWIWNRTYKVLLELREKAAEKSWVTEQLKNINVPDASLTTKGKVQLSNSTNGVSEVLATTEKAVSTAKTMAISAAATDATTKANAAEASAKAYSDSKQTASIKPIEREVANLNLQLAAASRVSNGVTFGSNFADSFGMTFDLTKTSTTSALAVGAKYITVASASGLTAGMEVTIFDDVNLERVTITSISGTMLTVPALTKAYKSGANVARTMAVLDATNRMLQFGGWTTSVTYTVTDSSVTNAAYDTSGNGGRKLIRLNSGTLVSVTKDAANNLARLYKSNDNGATWVYFAGWGATSIGDVALSTNGTYIYVAYCASNISTMVMRYSENGNQLNVYTVDSTQSALGRVSLAINDAGTELHATWDSRNSTYPNSFNIRYAKGTIAGDGTVVWGAVTQLTANNSTGADNTNPCIIVKSNNNPVIMFQQNSSVTVAGNWIQTYAYNGTAWTGNVIYSGGGQTYTQANVSAIFVPQSVNGLANGRIWVAWQGTDSTDTGWNIRISYSDDGGVTWSAMQKLTTGNIYDSAHPSLAVTKNGDVTVYFYGKSASSGAAYRIRSIKYSAGTWGAASDITVNTTGLCRYPSALLDVNLDANVPPFIYLDNQNGKVGFYGTWKATGNVPITENDVRFTVKDTSEAVMWTQRDAALTVDAALNGQAMDKTTSGNEDQFVKALGSSGKAEIRLKLKRASTSADIGISRILGGVS